MLNSIKRVMLIPRLDDCQVGGDLCEEGVPQRLILNRCGALLQEGVPHVEYLRGPRIACGVQHAVTGEEDSVDVARATARVISSPTDW